MTTDAALRFLRGHHEQGDGRPFFLCVGYTDTHSPFSGEPERLVDHYRRHPLQNVPREPYASAHGDMKWWPEPGEYDESLAQYAAAVTAIDEQIGRLLDELDGMRQLENTLVVYTADHGHNNGHHGLWLKGNGTTPANFLDGSTLVPCLLAWPGVIGAGQVSDAMVDHCDLHATLLDAAGVTRSQEEIDATHGRSYLPLLRGEDPAEPWRALQFGEYANARMVRSADGKLIRRYPGPNGHFRDEFYDLAADPRETRNAIDDPACAERIAALSQALDAFFARYEVPGRRGTEIERIATHNVDEPWRRALRENARGLLR